MPLERRISRSIFTPAEVVELRQMCLTPGRVFEPGKYLAGDLPDIAFEMGLVEKLPPVRGFSEEVAYVPSDTAALTDTDKTEPGRTETDQTEIGESES